ncbi:RNA polymerase sigma factor [Dactylosporangium sucinum]|uniref:RNA polymerase sigma factor 70 region 4 type 2 domain-containing protein n=1 Tax=Dactylosporangium sucinum TaxID=1424081 RepID=A0A917THM1_9ACTN|nr:sigma-70 family RNA polymerase sigma factor [Dactylosporangium sucinum]GGM22957.1 hypothetical protein GCM10007977_025170 [Dactylosporangium sucinum]
MSRLKLLRCTVCNKVLFTNVEAWYRAEQAVLRRYVGRLAASRGVPQSILDPDDVVQDVFEALEIALWSVNNPAGWLRTVAKRRVARAHGKMRRSSADSADEYLVTGRAVLWSSLVDPDPDIEELLSAQLVWELIARLPNRQRQAVYLEYVAGMPRSAIAERLGIAAATVGVHAFRALRALREALFSNQDAVDEEAEAIKRALTPWRPAEFADWGATWWAWTWCPCWSGLPEKTEITHLMR